MKMLSAVLAMLVLGVCSLPAAAQDMPMHRPMDDVVAFDLSAEDWVTTKTARVTVGVEASVSSAASATMRTEMAKSVSDIAKADWRLTSFNRSTDQTGMERWSASYEARLPENELSGLNENAKKLSKQGLQLSIADIEFVPTLAEMEATRADLRTQLYKTAGDQLAALNAAMPGRTYRIAGINFTGNDGGAQPVPMMFKARAMMATAAPAPEEAPMERAQKITMVAHMVFATAPPPPSDQKH